MAALGNKPDPHTAPSGRRTIFTALVLPFLCNLAGSGGGRGGPADPQEVPIVAASKLVAVARDHELMSLAATLLANCTNAEQAGPRGDRGGGEDCGISRCGATELDDEGG